MQGPPPQKPRVLRQRRSVRQRILETGLGRASDRIRTRRERFFDVDLFFSASTFGQTWFG